MRATATVAADASRLAVVIGQRELEPLNVPPAPIRTNQRRQPLQTAGRVGLIEHLKPPKAITEIVVGVQPCVCHVALVLDRLLRTDLDVANRPCAVAEDEIRR